MMITNTDSDRTPRPIRSAGSDDVWPLLGLIGLAFAIIGSVDLTLAWFPSAFGSAEWEFGTIGASLNGLPLPALGLMLVLASGIARGSRWQVRAAAIAFVVLVVALIGVALVYVTVVPVALADVTNGAVRTGLLKSIVKALVLVAVYPVLFGWAGYRGFRWLSTSSARSSKAHPLTVKS
jgi:cellobiose-specific phosphotransferase system component IIC